MSKPLIYSLLEKNLKANFSMFLFDFQLLLIFFNSFESDLKLSVICFHKPSRVVLILFKKNFPQTDTQI